MASHQEDPIPPGASHRVASEPLKEEKPYHDNTNILESYTIRIKRGFKSVVRAFLKFLDWLATCREYSVSLTQIVRAAQVAPASNRQRRPRTSRSCLFYTLEAKNGKSVVVLSKKWKPCGVVRCNAVDG